MADPLTAHKLIFEKPGRVEVRAVTVPPPGPGETRVVALCSAISAGSEMLLYRGQMPADVPLDASIAGMEQSVRYPLGYGYAIVGRVDAVGPGVDLAWEERLVFAFHPHQSIFLVNYDQLIPVPEDMTPQVAALLPNMETAVSLVMDGQPVIGEEVLVLGQGVVGLMLTALLSEFPLASLTTVDQHLQRREVAADLGADLALSPQEIGEYLQSDSIDLCYEVSGNPAALDTAITYIGFAGRILVGSWYGQKIAPIALGGSFHRKHVRLVSSQVSRLHPRWTGRWTKARRLDLAWRRLRHLPTDLIVTRHFPIEQACQAYDLLDRHSDRVIQLLLTY